MCSFACILSQIRLAIPYLSSMFVLHPWIQSVYGCGVVVLSAIEVVKGIDRKVWTDLKPIEN